MFLSILCVMSFLFIFNFVCKVFFRSNRNIFVWYMSNKQLLVYLVLRKQTLAEIRSQLITHSGSKSTEEYQIYRDPYLQKPKRIY